MDREAIANRLDQAIEELAAIEHQRWSHWQRYMHEKGAKLDDGSLVIPPYLVSRWERQFDTPYERLSEIEKESDRQQVKKYLPTIIGMLILKEG